MKTPTKPRRADGKQTEERLLDTALTLFSERGYEATSIRSIIDAAGITAPVLYYYGGSKKQLFERVVQWKHEDAYRELESLIESTDDTVDRLRGIIRGSFAFCAGDPRVPRLMFQTWYGPYASELRDLVQAIADRRFLIIASVIQDGLDQGVLQGGDAASLALVFCSLMDHHSGALSRLEYPERLLTQERADALLEVFLRGVGVMDRAAPQLPPFVLGSDSTSKLA